MKISWIILTYNRAVTVKRAIPHCVMNAGHPVHEIIWVDNGSSLQERIELASAIGGAAQTARCRITQCMLPENTGVAQGYNTAMALARGTHLVITGCDMLMPDHWLANMASPFDRIDTGISMVFAAPIESTPERVRGQPFGCPPYRLQEAMPIGRRLLSVELQREIGYFHEGFGMYGWDDVFWGKRAEVVLKQKGLKAYCLIDQIAEHLGTEGNVGYDHKDEHEYWRWKKAQVNDPAKQKLLSELERQGWPRFSPY